MISGHKRLSLHLTPARIEALTDGVFAIVMTLLVLELGVPVIAGASVRAELLHSLGQMWPEFFSYIVSFLLLGFMWVLHHYHFRFIERSDSVLAWINLLFLMFVSLLPFTTTLLGEYIDEPVAFLIYGANIFACMILRLLMWNYATNNFRLIKKDTPPEMIKRTKMTLPLGMAAIAVAMVVAIFSTIASVSITAVIFIFFIVRSTIINRIRLT